MTKGIMLYNIFKVFLRVRNYFKQNGSGKQTFLLLTTRVSDFLSNLIQLLHAEVFTLENVRVKKSLFREAQQGNLRDSAPSICWPADNHLSASKI